MDAQLKAKWIEALRSGKYSQARGTLKDSIGRFCCLGVLADIQGLDIEAHYPTPLLRETSSLPPEFCAGTAYEDRATLANMNDGDLDGNNPRSFAEIADFIEASL